MAPFYSKRMHEIQENKTNTLKVACWNCGGKNLVGRISEIKALAILNRLDIFCVVECCLKVEDDRSLVEMEGYDLLVEEGIYEKRRSAARVVVYIKSNLAYQQLKVRNHDLIPEVWLKAGHKGKKRSTYAFLYREWRRWNIPRPAQGLPDHEGSCQAQHQRLKDWLEARDTLIQTSNETHLLGDINIEGREGKERDEALYSLLREHLIENGYVIHVSTTFGQTPQKSWRR